MVEPGVYLGRSKAMHASVGAQNLGHSAAPIAGQQDQELRLSRGRVQMGDQHRASLGQQPTHRHDPRVHRLDFQPDLIGGILHETGECGTIGNVGWGIAESRRPSLGQEALGDGQQSLAQPAGRPRCGRRAHTRGRACGLVPGAHTCSPCTRDGARSSICPLSMRKCRHSGPSKRARARTSAASKCA